MPSHLVATVLLNYRNGISKSVLVQQTNLLRLEILKRGGRVVGSQGRTPTAIVDHALELLKDLVVRRRKDLVEPAITTVSVALFLLAFQWFFRSPLSSAMQIARAISKHDWARLLSQ